MFCFTRNFPCWSVTYQARIWLGPWRGSSLLWGCVRNLKYKMRSVKLPGVSDFIPQQSENLCKISKIFSSSFSFSSTLQAATRSTTRSWLTCQGKGVKCTCITQIGNHRLQNDLRVSSNRCSYHISSLFVCICQKNRLSQGWNEVSAARDTSASWVRERVILEQAEGNQTLWLWQLTRSTLQEGHWLAEVRETVASYGAPDVTLITHGVITCRLFW